MSNILTNSLETKTYTVFLASVDKASGTNNQASFQINWDDFLPREYDQYKMTFSFQSGGGNYLDKSFSCAATANGTNGTNTFTVTTTSITGTMAVGQIVSGPASIPSGTYITAVSGVNTPSAGLQTITISKKLTATLTLGSPVGSIVYSGCKITCDSLGRSYSYDSNTKGPSITLGYAQRDIQSSTSTSNSFSAFYLQFPPKTISRPNQNFITFGLYNLNNGFLLTDTTSGGVPTTDCTNWNIILEFIPVLNSGIKNSFVEH